MWELDYKESRAPKNWGFWTVVLEKTLESPLDCKIKPVNPEGNQFWIFIGRTVAEAKVPVLWPLDVKNWLLGKDPDAGKDWRQEEKGTTEDEMVEWHHQLEGREFEQAPGGVDGHGSLACCSPWGHRVGHNWATELNCPCHDYYLDYCHDLAQRLKHLPGMWETQVRPLGQEDALEKEMATHSSTLAWRIPWREEPGVLQSMGSQRVGHDWATSLHFNCHDYYLEVFTREKDWLFILFLLLLPFWRAKKRLIVNSSTRAPLSCLRKCKEEASFKYPVWNPLLRIPWDANRRPVVNV